MNAADRLAEIIEQVSSYLKMIQPSIIPVEQYEATYKQLQGIKGFWDNASWDDIQKELRDDWLVAKLISDARKDLAFKKYYNWRIEADKLMEVAK